MSESMREWYRAAPSHPGSILEDVLEGAGITQAELARGIFVSRSTISQIILGKRSITVDMALRLGTYLGNGPNLWIKLQRKFDVYSAKKINADIYEKIKAGAKGKWHRETVSVDLQGNSLSLWT